MSAATAHEWLAAAGVGTGVYGLGVLLLFVLGPRLARESALLLAALVLYLTPTQGGEPQ